MTEDIRQHQNAARNDKKKDAEEEHARRNATERLRCQHAVMEGTEEGLKKRDGEHPRKGKKKKADHKFHEGLGNGSRAFLRC
jgi:hypothetical protein